MEPCATVTLWGRFNAPVADSNYFCIWLRGKEFVQLPITVNDFMITSLKACQKLHAIFFFSSAT